ncbi:hypothetical protein Glove_33g120 [Diversispora epigaea]|uniref:Uncharacterized protein n=1 Tax=Diversispora epigaea TaxID=1348612 RepID=A0A397JJ84_9GLOM|nr:hypothetical protein Glove_33g120 [Diversispora epigaea]
MDKFKDVQIGESRFGTIHYARWIDGFIFERDIKDQQWKRRVENEVALKKFDNFVGFNDVLNEIYTMVTYGIFTKVKAKKIIIDAMEEFQQILKQIWKERCDKVIEWEVNNGITNKDKRIKQTKEKLNTNNQVVKTSNIQKRNNYNINNLKIIEEKEYIQNKQKQKKTNLEFFVNESFLNTNTLKETIYIK